MSQTGAGGQAAPEPANRRRRLGEVLVSQGVLTDAQLQECLAAQSQLDPSSPRRRLGIVVVDRGLADERQIASALASALALEMVDLGRRIVDAEVVRMLPRAVAERLGVLILGKQGPIVTVATADPTNVVALDDTKLYTGASQLEVVVATESQVREHLSRAWSLSEDSPDVAGLFDDMGDTPEEEPTVSAESAETAPIVRLADVVFSDAVRARVSDVHVEPQHDGLRIRYRVDGLLRDVMTVPRSASAALVSRIKIVSGLDIAERRRPQDGRTRLKVDGTTVDARVSTLPTLHGEKVVVRLLARADDIPDITSMGMSPTQMHPLLTTLESPQGLVLITGPTGSGKTSTLYSAIQRVSTPERNIVTLEDPVEIQFRGITQVQVNEKAGMTFGAGLRSVLRQDPDIVLVGEVRDTETARLALEASLTGHLVLTTLHTNSAVAAVTRLVDMGVEPFLVASSLSLVVAQRLVRTPCATCSVRQMPSEATMTLLGLTPDDLAGATPRQGRGCSDCGSTGYRGRSGIYEVLPISAKLRAVLLAGGGEAEISAAAAAEGLVTLRAAALQAAAEGRTTYEEVLRVTHVDGEGGSSCPSCARGVADDMVICPWCATEIDRGGCGGCGRRSAPGWRVCPWCRTPAGSAASAATLPVVQVAPAAAPALALVPPVEPVESALVALAPVEPVAYARVEPMAFEPVEPMTFAPVEPVPFENVPVEPMGYAPVEPVAFEAVEPMAFEAVEPMAFEAVEPMGYAPVEPVPFENVPVEPTEYAAVEPAPFENVPVENVPVEPVARLASVASLTPVELAADEVLPDASLDQLLLPAGSDAAGSAESEPADRDESEPRATQEPRQGIEPRQPEPQPATRSVAYPALTLERGGGMKAPGSSRGRGLFRR